MAEALAEAAPAIVLDLGFTSQPQEQSPQRLPLGAEVHQLKREVALLLPALRGLLYEENPELREFYQGYLDVLRYDAVFARGMGNGFFRALCFEGARWLRAEAEAQVAETK